MVSTIIRPKPTNSFRICYLNELLVFNPSFKKLEESRLTNIVTILLKPFSDKINFEVIQRGFIPEQSMKVLIPSSDYGDCNFKIDNMIKHSSILQNGKSHYNIFQFSDNNPTKSTPRYRCCQ